MKKQTKERLKAFVIRLIDNEQLLTKEQIYKLRMVGIVAGVIGTLIWQFYSYHEKEALRKEIAQLQTYQTYYQTIRAYNAENVKNHSFFTTVRRLRQNAQANFVKYDYDFLRTNIRLLTSVMMESYLHRGNEIVEFVEKNDLYRLTAEEINSKLVSVHLENGKTYEKVCRTFVDEDFVNADIAKNRPGVLARVEYKDFGYLHGVNPYFAISVYLSYVEYSLVLSKIYNEGAEPLFLAYYHQNAPQKFYKIRYQHTIKPPTTESFHELYFRTQKSQTNASN